MAETAVDWLFTTLDNMLELYPSEWEKVSKAVEEAKEMEKEQIRMAFTDGHWDGQFEKLTSEEYYNEQYGK
jgi:hypothetical protein